MPVLGRRRTVAVVFTGLILFFLYSFGRLGDVDRPAWATTPHAHAPGSSSGHDHGGGPTSGSRSGPLTSWGKLQPHYPVESMRPLPAGTPLALPKVQHDFGPESADDRDVRLKRRDAVKASFRRCWSSYRKYAWTHDEIAPVSGTKKDRFGGWGATLVDGLDTLWIMGMKDEFKEAVAAAAKINFNKVPAEDINLFETNIRYLGGFLAAYDLSGDERMLTKAREVGELLYAAFDTPNRMPVTRWDARRAGWGTEQVAHSHVVLAEIGSFSLEFIRLSLLTGDPKWFDANQRIIDALRDAQMSTRLPGMWPVVIDAQKPDFGLHTDHSLGALADSLYEYLVKTHALVGGQLPVYREMFDRAMDTAIRHNLFRPMLPDEKDVLVSGTVSAREEKGKPVRQLRPEGQHLVCFAGGMFALGGKLFENATYLDKGAKLTDGCIWTYQALPLGIMPERFHMLACESADHCPWDEDKWRRAVVQRASLDSKITLDQADEVIKAKRIPKGFTALDDPAYILRPEAIESVFLLYRMTGRKDLPDAAWKMFEAIEENTKTSLATSALDDISITEGKPKQVDSMESFWLGETLKYFYLMFSEPDLIDLDEYVFNTEAHPLKRLRP
ncbi:glycoside hydrolase [Staphylotrichum tortipilum]|uniref:alpha-1,2-Mannosidase n=1 Tax=Staphylotrichum tortipilum TaxID=2831512 RepID=A0AAN6RS42_9PEZI|nr:glycoside hydrolase [Staphylotrichum longicolle]